jgi:hypothetical protein
MNNHHRVAAHAGNGNEQMLSDLRAKAAQKTNMGIT